MKQRGRQLTGFSRFVLAVARRFNAGATDARRPVKQARHLAPLLLLLAGPAAAQSIVADVTTDQARYQPHQRVMISVRLHNSTGHAIARGRVRLVCRHLDTALGSPAPQTFSLAPGASKALTFVWVPPAPDFQGYAVEAAVTDGTGHSLGSQSTAVDVSSTWTRFPRYGFLSTFPAQPPTVSQQTLQQLNVFHINALQFYDWQFKHHQPLAGTVTHPASSWKDIANRPIFRQTVRDLIHAAHNHGMAAMNYNLLYGAWSGYGGDGVDFHWGLWKNTNGTNQDSFALPAGWATPTVYLFNPANAGWQDFLFNREADAFAAYPFDGWQVDQLGDRGPEYDFSGQPITLWKTFTPFLNAAKARLHTAIVFNNVGGYGLYDTAAHSTEDAVYIECWEESGQRNYDDLKTLIGQASAWSGGKGVVLAAYLDRAYAHQFSAEHPGHFNAPGVLLADAVLFASGGAHIELGDGAQMLDSEYFPNRNLVLDNGLRQTLRRYYDFLVAYENLLRGGLTDSPNVLTMGNVPTSNDAAPNTVWAFSKAGPGRQVLHLINLVGEKDTAWRDDHGTDPVPTPQANLTVKDYFGAGTVTSVYWATPDVPSGLPHRLAFTAGADDRGRYVQFTIPRLAYWDLVSLTLAPPA